MTLDTFGIFIAAGAAIGFCIGCTGIGGGSLMMPVLLSMGIPPQVAVGTDLLYASITKCTAVVSHQRQRNINWKTVALLLLGSIPASLITLYMLRHLQTASDINDALITRSLGTLLILTAMTLIFRSRLYRWANSHGSFLLRHAVLLSVLTGIFLGICVTLSSVGAGVIGTALLMLIYARYPSRHMVGTDIAHAVPLTFIAGSGHMFMGGIDGYLLLALLLGSIPAVYFGASMSRRMPDRLLRSVLTVILLGMGIHYLWPA